MRWALANKIPPKMNDSINCRLSCSDGWFIIVLNVLVVFLNNNDQLLPFVSNANKKFLAQCFADDLNLATKSLNTLAKVFDILEDFKKVSGLKVNFDKTKGIFFNKTGLVNNLDMLPIPYTNWNCNLKILGIPHGSSDFVHQFWENILCDVKSNLSQYNSVYSTFDSKSIITKSLILPKFSYTATVLSMPTDIKRSLDVSVFRFIVPKGDMRIELMDLAQKGCLGSTTSIMFQYMHLFLF